MNNVLQFFKKSLMFHMYLAEVVSHIANNWINFYLSRIYWNLVHCNVRLLEATQMGIWQSGHLECHIIWINKGAMVYSHTPIPTQISVPKQTWAQAEAYQICQLQLLMVQRKPETNKPQRNLQLLWRGMSHANINWKEKMSLCQWFSGS